MPKTLTEPRYIVVRPGDRGYKTLQDHFPDLPNNTVYTVVSGVLPSDIQLTPKNFIIARYYLDKIIAGQTCVATRDGQAAADIFFDQIYRITGIERIHALAHLILSVVGDYTDEKHVTDRAFVHEDDFYLAFSAELNEELLHDLVERLWQDLYDLLTKGAVKGYIRKVFDRYR